MKVALPTPDAYVIVGRGPSMDQTTVPSFTFAKGDLPGHDGQVGALPAEVPPVVANAMQLVFVRIKAFNA